MTACACGCGRPVAKRKGAKYASARCRRKAWSADHSPTLSAAQCKLLRAAAYWISDYARAFTPDAADTPETAEAVRRTGRKLGDIAADLRRLVRGAGQRELPLRSRREAFRTDSRQEVRVSLP